MALEAVKKGKRADIGVLHHLVRILLITRQPAGHMVGDLKMREDGLLEAGEFLGRVHGRSSHDGADLRLDWIRRAGEGTIHLAWSSVPRRIMVTTEGFHGLMPHVLGECQGKSCAGG